MKIRITHQAPGFQECEIAGNWTIDTANAYVDRTMAILGTTIRIYLGDTVIRSKVCDPRG